MLSTEHEREGLPTQRHLAAVEHLFSDLPCHLASPVWLVTPVGNLENINYHPVPWQPWPRNEANDYTFLPPCCED